LDVMLWRLQRVPELTFFAPLFVGNWLIPIFDQYATY
jgi:hypothetical protein